MTSEMTSKQELDPWIGVDLDGTLALSIDNKDLTVIGEPVPRMVEFVKILIAQGNKVKIMTARVSEPKAKARLEIEVAIREWCIKHLGHELEPTCVKDYAMTALYDNRAYHVITDKGIVVGPEHYTAWN